MAHQEDSFARVAPVGSWRSLQVVALCCPLLWIATLHACWLAAWITIGHVPRTSLDDPADSLGILYWISGVFVVGLMPLSVALGLWGVGHLWLSRRIKLVNAFARTLFIAGCWLAAITVARIDPFDAVAWWGD